MQTSSILRRDEATPRVLAGSKDNVVAKKVYIECKNNIDVSDHFVEKADGCCQALQAKQAVERSRLIVQCSSFRSSTRGKLKRILAALETVEECGWLGQRSCVLRKSCHCGVRR